MKKTYTKEEIENALSTAKMSVENVARELWTDERVLIETTIKSYEITFRAALRMKEENEA